MDAVRLFVAALLLIAATTGHGQTELTKEFALDPVNMTYADVSSILDELKEVVGRANGDFIRSFEEQHSFLPIEWIRVSVSSEQDTLELKEWGRLSDVRGVPTVGYSMRMSYELLGAPISNIRITLTDGYRSVSIRGTDAAQVNAVSALLRERFDSYSKLLGGSTVRMYGGASLLLLGWVLSAATDFFLMYPNKWPLKRRMLVSILLALLLIGVIFLLPWSRWLPGVAIYSGSASFIDRYINVISAFGVVLTIAIPVASMLWHRFSNKTSA